MYLWHSSSTAYAADDNSKNKTLFAVLLEGIRVYSRGIVGLTEQWTAFTSAQGAILQSRDFIWHVERAKFRLSHAGQNYRMLIG